MPIHSLDAISPRLPAEGRFYVAPGAHLIGDVRLGEMVSVWFNAVLRADSEPITIGDGSNVQDGCVFHVDPGFPLTLGEDVTVGHGAILHGCTIGDGALIGMGATVLNGAVVGVGALIGAGALVTEGKTIPDGAVVMGQPGKVIRTLDDAGRAALAETAAGYRARLMRYAKGLSSEA
ncbi:MAG: gamma carbonic anhydrase family protein [Pseudomonadota bacterium]